MAKGADELACERADAASSIVEDLKRNGLPEETAHDLLLGYAQAIEGAYREEWGARRVMVAAGALPGSLSRFRDAKKQEILNRINSNVSAPGHWEQQE